MTPKQAQWADPGEALEAVQGANGYSNIAVLRAETALLRWLANRHGFEHPDGASFDEHVQLALLDYYSANPGQARAECEAAGTPLVPGTLYLDPQDDQD